MIETHVPARTSLTEIMAADDPERGQLLVPFNARYRGEPVVVLAVLERTAVVYPARTPGEPDERVVARQGEVLVGPGCLRWRESVRARRASGSRMHVHTQPRRCPDCRRTAAQTRFSDPGAVWCVECGRGRKEAVA